MITVQLNDADWNLIGKALAELQKHADNNDHMLRQVEKDFWSLLDKSRAFRDVFDALAGEEKQKKQKLSEDITILQAKIIELKRYEKRPVAPDPQPKPFTS